MEIFNNLLWYQWAVVKEGLNIDFEYCLEFLPALVRAYQLAGWPDEGMLVIQEMMRWNVSREKAIELMQ